MKFPNPLVHLALPAALLVTGAPAVFACPFASSVSSQPSQTLSAFQTVTVSNTVGNGFIGVGIESLSPERAKELNQKRAFGSVPEINGVLITQVFNGPAQQSGVQVGDVLLGVKGQLVSRVDQVQQLISNTPVGQQVPVTLRRGNDVITLGIAVGDRNILINQLQNR